MAFPFFLFIALIIFYGHNICKRVFLVYTSHHLRFKNFQWQFHPYLLRSSFVTHGYMTLWLSLLFNNCGSMITFVGTGQLIGLLFVLKLIWSIAVFDSLISLILYVWSLLTEHFTKLTLFKINVSIGLYFESQSSSLRPGS